MVFKAALSKGYFPSLWKISEVILVFKDEDRADVKQYRPLSLLCNASKVFEKVIFNELYDIVKTTQHNAHHGFRRRRSVITQMLLFLCHLCNKFDGNQKELLVLYLDFKKAFDSVPHDIVLYNIEMVGIGGNFLKFTARYLSKRKQYVKLNDFNSETVQVTSGVPQGSLLGPLLFIVFYNDLALQLSKCEAFGYTDDFKLFATNSENMQYVIKQIEELYINNKMTINENKCYILPIESQDKRKLSLNNGTKSDLLLKRKHFSVRKNYAQNSMRTQDLWYQLLRMQLKPGSPTKRRRRRSSALKSYWLDLKQLGTELQEEACKT